MKHSLYNPALYITIALHCKLNCGLSPDKKEKRVIKCPEGTIKYTKLTKITFFSKLSMYNVSTWKIAVHHIYVQTIFCNKSLTLRQNSFWAGILTIIPLYLSHICLSTDVAYTGSNLGLKHCVKRYISNAWLHQMTIHQTTPCQQWLFLQMTNGVSHQKT